MLMTTNPIDPSDSARHAALNVDPAARSDEDLRPETGSQLSPDLRARSGMPLARTAASGLLSGDEDRSPASLTGAQRFLRACLRQPVDRAPVWFLRQAGRYMAEYQAVRRHHSLLQICKTPRLAAEVTITAAEKLDVDAAIIFADLLLPFECMGLDFEFLAGEGPVIHHPVRTAADVEKLRTDRAHELGYVAEAIRKVVAHFDDRIGIIGFCGAPFT